jgi:methylisocitrate lyase
MAAAALKVYRAILLDGSTRNIIDVMQTREELYDFLGYYAYEEKMDKVLAGRTGE